MAIFDTDMRCLARSNAWQKLYQTPDDEIGSIHYKSFGPIPSHWVEAHKVALSGIIHEHVEERYILANGTTGWHRWQCSPWHNERGIVGGIIISTEDITIAKEREIELNNVLARFELIQQAAKIGMWDWDINGRSITFNAEYYEILGWENNKNISNEEFYDLIHPDDLVRVKSELNAALEGKAVYEAEFRIFRANDGKLRWIKDMGNIEFDGYKNPVRGYGAIIDITKQKLATEQSLRIMASETQKFTDCLLDGIWSVDRNGVTVYVNKSMAEMLGYSENEMIGRSIYSFLDATWRNMADAKLEQRIQGKAERYVGNVKHKNGTSARFVVGAQPITENDEFIGTIAMFSQYDELAALFTDMPK